MTEQGHSSLNSLSVTRINGLEAPASQSCQDRSKPSLGSPAFVKPTVIPRKRQRHNDDSALAVDEEMQDVATQPLVVAESDQDLEAATQAYDSARVIDETRGASLPSQSAVNKSPPFSPASPSTLRASSVAPLPIRAAAPHGGSNVMEADGPTSAADRVSTMEKDIWKLSWRGAGKPGSLEDYIRERRRIIHGNDLGRESMSKTTIDAC